MDPDDRRNRNLISDYLGIGGPAIRPAADPTARPNVNILSEHLKGLFGFPIQGTRRPPTQPGWGDTTPRPPAGGTLFNPGASYTGAGLALPGFEAANAPVHPFGGQVGGPVGPAATVRIGTPPKAEAANVGLKSVPVTAPGAGAGPLHPLLARALADPNAWRQPAQNWVQTFDRVPGMDYNPYPSMAMIPGMGGRDLPATPMFHPQPIQWGTSPGERVIQALQAQAQLGQAQSAAEYHKAQADYYREQVQNPLKLAKPGQMPLLREMEAIHKGQPAYMATHPGLAVVGKPESKRPLFEELEAAMEGRIDPAVASQYLADRGLPTGALPDAYKQMWGYESMPEYLRAMATQAAIDAHRRRLAEQGGG